MSKILIADDDPDIIYILRTLLKREGHEIIEAYSGNECLEKIKKGKSDLVLLDVMMPDVDGWDVCKKIKEDKLTRSIPVAILSVRREEEDIKKSFEYAHADEHLPKPINFRQVVSTVEALLRKGVICREPRDNDAPKGKKSSLSKLAA